jgi:hypothetical protein
MKKPAIGLPEIARCYYSRLARPLTLWRSDFHLTPGVVGDSTLLSRG